MWTFWVFGCIYYSFKICFAFVINRIMKKHFNNPSLWSCRFLIYSSKLVVWYLFPMLQLFSLQSNSCFSLSIHVWIELAHTNKFPSKDLCTVDFTIVLVNHKQISYNKLNGIIYINVSTNQNHIHKFKKLCHNLFKHRVTFSFVKRPTRMFVTSSNISNNTFYSITNIVWFK